MLDVRDLWPQVAGELGKVRSSRALAAATALEHRLYRSAAAITTTTEPFREHIGRYTESSKVTVIPNGTTRDWMAIGESEIDPASVGLDPGALRLDLRRQHRALPGPRGGGRRGRRLGNEFQLLILGDGASRPRPAQIAAAAPAGRSSSATRSRPRRPRG